LSDLVAYLQGYPINRFFRTWKYIRDPTVIQRLLLLLNTAQNMTSEHISEIHKLETYAVGKHGRMYYDRLNGFSWNSAGELMRRRGLI
jgi:hypothetical protein